MYCTEGVGVRYWLSVGWMNTWTGSVPRAFCLVPWPMVRQVLAIATAVRRVVLSLGPKEAIWCWGWSCCVNWKKDCRIVSMSAFLSPPPFSLDSLLFGRWWGVPEWPTWGFNPKWWTILSRSVRRHGYCICHSGEPRGSSTLVLTCWERRFVVWSLPVMNSAAFGPCITVGTQVHAYLLFFFLSKNVPSRLGPGRQSISGWQNVRFEKPRSRLESRKVCSVWWANEGKCASPAAPGLNNPVTVDTSWNVRTNGHREPTKVLDSTISYNDSSCICRKSTFSYIGCPTVGSLTDWVLPVKTPGIRF